MKKEYDQEEKISQTKWMIDHADERSLEELLGQVKGQKTVADILLPRLGERDMSVEVMSQLAGFGRATGYKIMKNTMRSEQDILIRIAFVLEFTPEETQELLKCGHRSLLTGESKRDVAIIYGLRNGLSLGEMDAVLEEYGLPVLVPPLK